MSDEKPLIDPRLQQVVHLFFVVVQTAIFNEPTDSDLGKWLQIFLTFAQSALAIYGIYTPPPVKQ